MCVYMCMRAFEHGHEHVRVCMCVCLPARLTVRLFLCPGRSLHSIVVRFS